MLQKGNFFAPRTIILPLVLIAGFIAICPMPAVSKANKDGVTDLIRAIRDGQIEKMDKLLKHNQDINAQDDYGWTALTTHFSVATARS
jgi:hypothetical protein